MPPPRPGRREWTGQVAGVVSSRWLFGVGSVVTVVSVASRSAQVPSRGTAQEFPFPSCFHPPLAALRRSFPVAVSPLLSVAPGGSELVSSPSFV